MTMPRVVTFIHNLKPYKGENWYDSFWPRSFKECHFWVEFFTHNDEEKEKEYRCVFFVLSKRKCHFLFLSTKVGENVCCGILILDIKKWVML